MTTRAWLWLRSILFRARREREMHEELSAHCAARLNGSRPVDPRRAVPVE